VATWVKKGEREERGKIRKKKSGKYRQNELVGGKYFVAIS
jgi:hypothetical protein